MSDINAFSVLPARSRDYHLHDDFQGSGRKLTPENFPQGVNRIVDGIRQLLAASNMNQLCSTMGLFAKDLVWSTPSVIMSRKGHLRVSSYFSHFVANYDLEADTAQVFSLAGGRNLVQLEATMWVKPHRTWLLLPTLLLPKAVPLKVTYKIGVNGPLESGKIEVVHARLHNLPSLPLPLRAYAGVLLGTIPHATEFLWMPAAAFVAGDEFYRNKLNNVKDEVMDTTMDYVNWGQQTAKEVVDTTYTTARQVADTAMDTAQQIVGGVKETAYQTAAKVQDTAYTAAGMAQEAAGTAVGVVAGTVEVGREVGQKAATTAYDAGQKAAASAYDTTARVANRAAETAEDASLRARSAAQTAKEGARVTGQKTAAAASSPGGEAEHITSRQIPVVRAT